MALRSLSTQSKCISRCVLLFLFSCIIVLTMGIPILVEMMASMSYAKENGLTPCIPSILSLQNMPWLRALSVLHNSSWWPICYSYNLPLWAILDTRCTFMIVCLGIFRPIRHTWPVQVHLVRLGLPQHHPPKKEPCTIRIMLSSLTCTHHQWF